MYCGACLPPALFDESSTGLYCGAYLPSLMSHPLLACTAEPTCLVR